MPERFERFGSGEKTTVVAPRPFTVADEEKISSRVGRQNAAGRELAAGKVYLVVQNCDKRNHKLLIQKALQNTARKREVRCRYFTSFSLGCS